MITLLMALFIVMWAISSVNTTKFAELKVSLKQAFNGKLVEGGANVMGGASLMPAQPALVGDAPGQADRRPTHGDQPARRSSRSRSTRPRRPRPDRVRRGGRPREPAHACRRKLDEWAAEHGARRRRSRRRSTSAASWSACSPTTCSSTRGQRRAQAEPRRRCSRRSRRCSRRRELPNAVRVEGNTDNVPISHRRVPQNWELSAARATAVLQQLLATGRPAATAVSAAGYGEQRPLATNAVCRRAASHNRRVELVVLRRASLRPGRSHPDEEEADHRRPRAPVVVGGVYKFVLAPKPVPRQAEDRGRRRHRCSKEFLLNLDGGRYAKVTVALVMPHAAPAAVTAPATEAAGLPQEAAVRAIVTDRLTGIEAAELIEREAPPRGARADPKEIHKKTDEEVDEVLFTDITVQ